MELRSAFPTALALGAILGSALAVGTPRIESPASSRGQALAAMRSLTEVPVHFDLPIVANGAVERFVALFRDEQPDRMALYLKRSGRYEGMILSKLRARGMPEDLIYLSMIESGFNPNARSRASAVGLWQFMAPTARMYGLRVDSYVDERRDPDKSTDAALRYLQDLYAEFGAWNLAAAAYNTGSGRVGRLMRAETGATKGDESDFWKIRRGLPAETREYVPLIHAAALIGKEPEKYGLDHVERWLPLPTDTVQVPGRTKLEVVAAAAEVSVEEVRQLNPHLVRGMTPPGDDYPVSVPDGRSGVFAANFAGERARATAAEEVAPVVAKAKKAPVAKKAARTHRVKKGESLSVIAKRHGVSTAALQRANGLGKRSILRPGQVLRVPA